jgi:arabinofuranan 3-O-arabinosyltransferase
MSSNSRTAEGPSVFDAARRATGRSVSARWIERAGWVVFGLAAVFGILAFTGRPVGFDLAFYLDAARAIVEGRSPYESALAICEGRSGCFPYPPSTALLFVPLLAVPPSVATWSVVALLTGIAAALGAILVLPLPRAVRPWVATAIALFFPLLLELNLANLNLLTMALALVAWARRDRPLSAGVLLAAAVGLKMLAAPLLLFYLAAGRWRHVAWAAATGMIVIVATVPWIGRYWAELIPAVVWRSTSADVLGIRPEALRGTTGYLALAAAGMAILVAAGLGARRSAHRAREMHALALAATPLLAYGLTYPFLVLALPLLVAVTHAVTPRPALLILPGIAWLAMQMPLGMEAWRFGGLLLTIALGVWLFLRAAFVPARAPLPASTPGS